ncbi:MAG: hypothetical protein V3V17_11920, partial [Alphaproteobacteria bacterium]
AFARGCESGDMYSKFSRYETTTIRNVQRLLRELDNHRRRTDAEGPLVEYEQGGKGPVQKAG